MLDRLVGKPVAPYPVLHRSLHQKATEPISSGCRIFMKTVKWTMEKFQTIEI